MEFDEINPIGILLALVAGGVGFFTAHQMSVGLFWKIAAFLICGIVGFFVGNKILDN